MNMLSKSKNEQLEIAKTSRDVSVLEQLHQSPYMNVRRAVARNGNISSQIANNLAIDPVLNVSYMACQNPNSTIIRDLCSKSLTHCVLCENDERYLECKVCANKGKSLLSPKT